MFCKNCGKELPDTAKFCGGCGSSVTPAVPEEALDGQPEVQEVPVTQAPPEIPASVNYEAPVDPETSAEAGPIPAAVKRRGKGGLIVIGGIAVAAILVVVLLVKLVGGLIGGGGGGGSRTQAFAYLTDKNELMYLSDLKEKTQAIEVTDKDDPSGVCFTKDGKTLYFKDKDGTLYKVAVADLKKGTRPERVARDVSRYNILDNGSVLYSKYDYNNSTYEVTCVTAKEDFRLIKECSNYSLSEDQKSVYYTEYDKDDREYTLYKIALKKDADEEELLDGYSNLYTDYDSSVLVYDENDYDPNAPWDEDADNNTRTVYSCKPGGDPTELQDDVYSVYGVKVDGSKVSFYYTVQDVEKFTLYDLVTDKKASEDAATLAEDLVWPSWYSGYYPDDVYFENNAWHCQDYNGDIYTVDVSSLLNTYGGSIADLYYYDVWYLAVDEAQARYSKAEDDYYSRYEVYEAAQNREYIRENLKSNETRLTSLSLFHYTGSSDPDAVATGINQSYMAYAAEEGVFVYKKSDAVSGNKVGDVSDSDIYDKIYSGNSGNSDDDWYQCVGDEESVLDFDEDVTNINGIYALNGKEIVMTLSFMTGRDDNRRSEAIVNAYTIEKTELKFASTVAEDEFSGLRMVEDAKGNDVLYFFTDVESKDRGTLGDLNKYSNGKTETVAKEIYGAYILDDSGAIYAATDISKKGEIELSLIQGDKPAVISDKITDDDIIFLDSKQLLYICDEDLYLWDGKAERKIAKDVTTVWANSKVGYELFTAYGYGYGGGYDDWGGGYGGGSAGGSAGSAGW